MDFEKARRHLVDGLRAHHIHENVLDAMGEIPRHFFVPEGAEELAYADTPLGIGFNQTISAPHMVAIMCDILDLRPGMNV
ncbi:MAG: protein-L-isoaspartate O-methyltransferase, partial [Methanosarcinales archaeon]|nr:protein-L-isoaspartate O-methyltransferase [Methanosarcinales archaeon]